MSVRQLSEREPLLAREDVPAQPTAYEPLGRRAVAAEDAARVFDNGIAHGKRQLGMIVHPSRLRARIRFYPLTRRPEHDIPDIQPADWHWVRPLLRVQRIYLHSLSSIFATPSIILRASGSVGFSLVMWTLGAAFAAAGTAVYIELGTVRL